MTPERTKRRGAEPRPPPRSPFWPAQRQAADRPLDELLLNALPAIALDPTQPIKPQALVSRALRRVWLEIGFGGGEHLAAEAEAASAQGFIGCESFENGVVKALSLIAAKDLDNVRLHQGDAGAIIDALPEPASTASIFSILTLAETAPAQAAFPLGRDAEPPRASCAAGRRTALFHRY